MALTAQARRFRKANEGLVRLAQRDLKSVWGALKITDDARPIRNAMLEFMPDLVTAYGDTAALLAADYYDEMRGVAASASRFATVMSAPPAVGMVAANTRWAMGPLYGANPDPRQALKNLGDATQRMVLQAGRETLLSSSMRDPVAIGWRRVTGGGECDLCERLADRGAVYTEATADFATHNNCNCIAEPVFARNDNGERADKMQYIASDPDRSTAERAELRTELN